jgi:hypothetical protein
MKLAFRQLGAVDRLTRRRARERHKVAPRPPGILSLNTISPAALHCGAGRVM